MIDGEGRLYSQLTHPFFAHEDPRIIDEDIEDREILFNTGSKVGNRIFVF